MLRFTEICLGGTAGASDTGVEVETMRDVAEVVRDVRQNLAAWVGLPGPNVSLGGAEPLRHPGLTEILAACVAAGAQRIRLDSDAVALASAGVAEDVIGRGVRHLRFTLHGSTPRMHDDVSGVTGSFDATCHGVRRFRETAGASGAPVHVTARVPVVRRNLQDVPATVAAAVEAGAASVLLSVEDIRLDLRDAAPWIEAGCDSGIVNSAWVEVEGVPFGLAAGWELHLSSVYHPVAGAKSARCTSCELDPVCGGAIAGASSEVVSVFRAPPEAAHLAERVRCGYGGPGEAAESA